MNLFQMHRTDTEFANICGVKTRNEANTRKELMRLWHGEI